MATKRLSVVTRDNNIIIKWLRNETNSLTTLQLQQKTERQHVAIFMRKKTRSNIREKYKNNTSTSELNDRTYC